MVPSSPSQQLTSAFIGALLLATAAPRAAAAAPPSPPPTVAEIQQRVDDLYRSESSHGRLTMTVVTKRYTRTMSLEEWTIGKDRALVVIRKPAREAGNASLKTDEGLWSYARRADRLVRIPSGLLSDTWMGSHFTNDDLMRESSYADDYGGTVERVSEGGHPVVRLTLLPKPDAAVVYTKLVYTLSEPGLLPLRLEFFDRDELVRRMTFDEVKDLGGRRIPTRLVLVPLDKPEESTTITYDAMEFDAKVPARLFSPQGLRRAAQR